jgi:hypothetical protein
MADEKDEDPQASAEIQTRYLRSTCKNHDARVTLLDCGHDSSVCPAEQQLRGRVTLALVNFGAVIAVDWLFK